MKKNFASSGTQTHVSSMKTATVLSLTQKSKIIYDTSITGHKKLQKLDIGN